MDIRITPRQIKAAIAVFAAGLLIIAATAAGYMLFSGNNSAENTTAAARAAESGADATGAAEYDRTDDTVGNANGKNYSTAQSGSAPTKSTSVSDLQAADNTDSQAAKPTVNAAKPHSENGAKITNSINSANGENGTRKTEQTAPQSRCTIMIDCKNAAEYAKNHPSVTLSGKAVSGIILQSTAVGFSSGDTAFDILKSVCNQNGIALEFTKTPLYNSYYIEGIGGLYEFDCGNASGWIYTVNGEKPSRSCSDYTIKNGDKIIFSYTCNNGADV